MFKKAESLWKTLSLSTRLNTVTTGILLVTMTLFVALDYMREREALLRAKVSELASIANATAIIVRERGPTTTKEELRSLAPELSSEEVVLHVVRPNDVWISSNTSVVSVAEFEPIPWSTDFSAWWTDGGLAVSVVSDSRSGAGTKVVAEASLAAIESILAQTLRMHVVHGLATVAAMALGIGWMISKTVLGPFGRMLSAMNVMERGTWEVDVPMFYRDEVGRLGLALNRLGKNLTDTARQFAQAEKRAALALFSLRMGRELNAPLSEIERGAARLEDPALLYEDVKREAHQIRSAASVARNTIDGLFEETDGIRERVPS